MDEVEKLRTELAEVNKKLEDMGDVDVEFGCGPNSKLLPHGCLDRADFELGISNYKDLIEKHVNEERAFSAELDKIDLETCPEAQRAFLHSKKQHFASLVAIAMQRVFEYRRALVFHFTNYTPIDGTLFRERYNTLTDKKLEILEKLHGFRKQGFDVGDMCD